MHIKGKGLSQISKTANKTIALPRAVIACAASNGVLCVREKAHLEARTGEITGGMNGGEGEQNGARR